MKQASTNNAFKEAGQPDRSYNTEGNAFQLQIRRPQSENSPHHIWSWIAGEHHKLPARYQAGRDCECARLCRRIQKYSKQPNAEVDKLAKETHTHTHSMTRESCNPGQPKTESSAKELEETK
jgi:hypothetical protein